MKEEDFAFDISGQIRSLRFMSRAIAIFFITAVLVLLFGLFSINHQKILDEWKWEFAFVFIRQAAFIIIILFSTGIAAFIALVYVAICLWGKIEQNGNLVNNSKIQRLISEEFSKSNFFGKTLAHRDFPGP